MTIELKNGPQEFLDISVRSVSERLREYRTQFELILEGERHVDQSRELYGVREQREIKCRKNLTKSTVKGAGEELKLMEERVIQAEKSKDLAYLEGECVMRVTGGFLQKATYTKKNHSVWKMSAPSLILKYNGAVSTKKFQAVFKMSALS